MVREVLCSALTLAVLSLPVAAAAAGSCDRQISEADHVLTGMFSRQEGSVTEITGFPLFSSARHLAYAACPTIESAGQEQSACRVGILEDQGGVMTPVENIRLEGTGAADGSNPAGPDYTAEGFTAGNARKLAESLKGVRTRICARFGADDVHPLRPIAGSKESPSGLDRDTYFELFTGCEDFGQEASGACRALTGAAGHAAAYLVRMRAGKRTTICSVSREGALLACRR